MDQTAIEQFAIPGLVLMERAGAAAFGVLQQSWPGAKRIAVFSGSGNNGGDGYVIARLAREAGLDVVLYQVGEHGGLKGDALSVADRLRQTDVPIQAYQGQSLERIDVVVDAILGTGLQGEVTDRYRAAIDAINMANTDVLAVDIPSGLHADTGQVLGAAVKAERTISFIAMKQGLYTGAAPEYCGVLHFAGLEVPEAVYRDFEPSAQSIAFAELKTGLRPRARTVHKGECGHVLVVGGELGLSGAARMAGEAALRVGAGLVSVATRAAHAAALNMTRPELMCHGIEDGEQLRHLLEQADVVAIGPGLGQGEWARDLFASVLASAKPLVVDADGLNLLAQQVQQGTNWVLTPHPGEAARLLAQTSSQIQADRYAAVTQLQEKFSGTVVLKGAGTLVRSADGPTCVCTDGNPGMASGGMGDVLTGVIAGLMAQGMSADTAAQLGVCLHGAAGDAAARAGGERGLLASDLMPQLRKLVNS